MFRHSIVPSPMPDQTNGAYLFNRGFIMKPKVVKIVFYSFVMIEILVLALLGGSPDSNAASDNSHPSVDQILDRVENKYTNSEFSAHFIQKSFLKAMDIMDQASGKVYIKYPGKMRWEYEKPDRQIFITDGEKLWVYRPDDNQVQVGKAPSFFKSGKGASFLSDISLVRQQFDISMKTGQQDENDPFYYLKLIPREKTLDITEILLMVSKQTYHVVQVITVDLYGDQNRIDLLNFAFGVSLDDALFSFSIPEGADVLQLDE
jgi:outer membrane lipoprotein carrier protein